MSGYITDTGTDSFDKAADWVTRDRKRRNEIGVDTAIREGVGEMMQRGGSAGYQPPMQSSWGGSAYQPPGAPTAPAPPVAAPTAPAAATPAVTPAPAQAAPGASLPAAQPEDPRFARLRMGTIRTEDPTGRAVNPWGFSGFYQFGTAALKDAGVYEPSQGEDLKRNAWTGTINLPSGKRLSHAEFNADPEAQKEAWDAHQARLGTEIDRRGLNRFIGQTVGGIPITEDAIRAMMHIGGANGAQLFLTTGGSYNPADANGTTLSGYVQRVLGGQGGAPGAGGGQGGGSVAGMGLFGQGGAPAAPDPATASQGAYNARMDPILSRLARTPGGGATALSVLGQQSKYDMAVGKRSDAYQRLAMTALGKGDIGLFQYYAKVGGLNIPDEVVQNAGVRQRLAIGSLTAERMYRDDPQQAAVFAQSYMQDGDVGRAFRAAGPPRSNPRITVQQVYDAETNTIQLLGVQTTGAGAGTATPIAGPDGQPVAGNLRPTAPAGPRIIQGPTGPMVVSPGAGTAQPVMGPDGQPVGPPPVRPSATPRPTIVQTPDGPVVVQLGGSAVPATLPDGSRVPAPPQRPAATPQPRVIQTDRGPMTLRPDGVAVPIATEDGAPVAAPVRPVPQRNLQVIQTSEGPMVLQPDGTATPITGGDGTQVRPNVANVRQPDRVVRLQMLRAAGFDEQAANSIAAGVRPSPNTIANTYTRVQKMVQDDFQIGPDKKAGETEGRMAAMFGPDWQAQMRGTPGQGGAQSPPAGGPPPRPQSVPPGSAYSPSRNLWRAPDGRMFKADGSPAT